MATPHNKANKGDIAKIVLMPGDPLRAKLIAETFLTDAVMFNDIRNMLGYTGFYNSKRVSVMGSGMGMPSMGIYSYELFKLYDVEKIIRVGSCGALVPELDLFDIILVDTACSDSNYAFIQNGSKDKIIESSNVLTDEIEETAVKERIKIIRGTIYSTDVFDWYQDREPSATIKENNCIAAEMEAFALFHNARIFKKEATCILTVSDSLSKNIQTSALEREKSFLKMVELALKSL